MTAQREYTPPIELDGGTIEIDTTPDYDGDLEITNRDGDHIVYLKPADQIVLRDLLHSIHPTKPRTITTAEELDALRFQAVVLDSYGTPYVCERHRTDGTRNEWRQAGMNSLDESEELAYHGPVTVVYEGEPQP